MRRIFQAMVRIGGKGMKIHFRVYNDYSMFDTKCLQMYLQDNDGNIFVLKDIVFEKYKRGVKCYINHRLK